MFFMEEALKEARNCTKDVPVGCVIVKDGEIIARGRNIKEEKNDVTCHAEIVAIREAERVLNNWRLDGCTMYVTLEPCPMCAWAIFSSRISNVYFGSYDDFYGAMGSKYDFKQKNLKIYGGIMEEECDKLINDFFERIRK